MKIPVSFGRVAAAFEEEAARMRICESSGSEHSPEEDLSDLVNSFMERDEAEMDRKEEDGMESESYWSNSENMAFLRSLLLDDDDFGSKHKIRADVKLALQLTGDSSSPGFKRQLMNRLRDRGLDAGMCKSRWEKNGNRPAGSYEYIDVSISGNRYIIEVALAGEFSIARPTTSYKSLLNVFPEIFVGKVEELKKLGRVMSGAARESMKSMGLSMPPWRRNSYMQAKWTSSYKRTTNGGDDDFGSADAAKQFAGFRNGNARYFKNNSGAKIVGGVRIGHFGAAALLA